MLQHVPVVLFIGQSNMKLEALPIAAAENIAAKGGLIVQYAVSGSPLSSELDGGSGDWSAGGEDGEGEHLEELLVRLDAVLTPGTSAYIPGSYLAGAIWVQGEADSATAPSSAAYQDNLIELKAVLVEEYGDHDWAVAALSGDVWDYRETGLNREPFWMGVRDAQLDLDGQDGFHVVDTDALASEQGVTTEEMFRDDWVHYDTEFATALGNSLADELDIEGDVKLQVGTSGNDHFIAESDGVQQVYGSAGTDIVDFSGFDHGIRLTAYERDLATVENAYGQSDFELNTVQVERVIGTDHDDIFRLGTITRDVRAGDGRDIVVGGDHGDAVRLGAGDDLAFGREGNDILIGQAGNDTLAGHNGNDRLYGGHGDDKILAGRGDDYIVGGRGDDEIRPHHGNDTLVYQNGNNGSDQVYGFSGTDDVITFTGTGVEYDDIFLSVEDSHLRIQVETDRMEADIRIENGADLYSDDPNSLDWLVI